MLQKSTQPDLVEGKIGTQRQKMLAAKRMLTCAQSLLTIVGLYMTALFFIVLSTYIWNIKIEECHLVIMRIIQMSHVSVGWEHASHRRRIQLANHVIEKPYVTPFGIKNQDSKYCIWHMDCVQNETCACDLTRIIHIFCKHKSRTANRTAFLSMNVVRGLPYNVTYTSSGEDVIGSTRHA
jgi:hypothetical protein